MTLRRKCIGSKHAAEASGVRYADAVGERSPWDEARSEGLVDFGEVIMLT